MARDEVAAVLESITGERGPAGNARWFRLADGFAHSACLQEVGWRLNAVDFLLPDTGRAMEVTVPFTQSFRRPDTSAEPLYRLYHSAIFWATTVHAGEDGGFWYELRDDRFLIPYFVRAEHLRPIAPEETAPLSPEVPADAKRIEVDLGRQVLTAYEHERPVLTTSISSGLPLMNPLPGKDPSTTPTGEFTIFKKRPGKHMGDGKLTAAPDAFEFPGVPWVSYYQTEGYAFHGAYWHNDFGRRRSHGCVNMRPAEALWIYRWTTPVVPLERMPAESPGTLVRIFE
jgi:hypothetical protein